MIFFSFLAIVSAFWDEISLFGTESCLLVESVKEQLSSNFKFILVCFIVFSLCSSILLLCIFCLLSSKRKENSSWLGNKSSSLYMKFLYLNSCLSFRKWLDVLEFIDLDEDISSEELRVDLLFWGKSIILSLSTILFLVLNCFCISQHETSSSYPLETVLPIKSISIVYLLNWVFFYWGNQSLTSYIYSYYNY